MWEQGSECGVRRESLVYRQERHGTGTTDNEHVSSGRTARPARLVVGAVLGGAVGP
ncbi:hypothetical protein NSPZN2_30268 [Nitrospira defluvii]|uniref:Uncharacterized protein n=1 Tax=Nitrospira defluvii TaxID=330214 RepID=A0ABM8RHJ8_9BACT|nr:hypothetical protein NSPZN2_30268 [Nitrospira defluvii]